MIVIDASLAVKWLFREADTPEAVHFLRAHRGELHAPDLVLIEVAGALVRRANEDKRLQADALRAVEQWTSAWTDHVVKTHRITRGTLFDASSLAIQIGHPLKDCVYLALARELDCELATCDVRLRDKAVDFYPRIRLLADYEGAPDTSA